MPKCGFKIGYGLEKLDDIYDYEYTVSTEDIIGKEVTVNDEVFFSCYDKLKILKTYFHNLSRESIGFSRWGVTIIPSSSLGELLNILLEYNKLLKSEELIDLIRLIIKALDEDEFIVCFGV